MWDVKTECVDVGLVVCEGYETSYNVQEVLNYKLRHSFGAQFLFIQYVILIVCARI